MTQDDDKTNNATKESIVEIPGGMQYIALLFGAGAIYALATFLMSLSDSSDLMFIDSDLTKWAYYIFYILCIILEGVASFSILKRKAMCVSLARFTTIIILIYNIVTLLFLIFNDLIEASRPITLITSIVLSLGALIYLYISPSVVVYQDQCKKQTNH